MATFGSVLRNLGSVLNPQVAKELAAEEQQQTQVANQVGMLGLQQRMQEQAAARQQAAQMAAEERAHQRTIQSPEYQARVEALRRQKAYEDAVAKSGGDLSQIARAGLQYGKPEVALSVIERQESRLAAAEQKQRDFQIRQEQADRDFNLSLERIKDQRERDRATAMYRDASLKMQSQNQAMNNAVALQRLEVERLKLDIAVQKATNKPDRPLTEFQGKNVLFGSRASVADSILTNLEKDASTVKLASKQTLGKVPLVGGMLEAGANLALSDDEQRIEQAQRDFVNATLRQESGATIQEQEFQNAKKQYFPQPGDSKEVIAQKRRNRQTAIMGFKKLAGPGADAIDEIVAQQGFKPKAGQPSGDLPPPPPGFELDK